MDEGYLHKGGIWTDIKEFQAGTCHLLVLNAAFETIARPLLTPKRKVWGAASLVRQVAATWVLIVIDLRFVIMAGNFDRRQAVRIAGWENSSGEGNVQGVGHTASTPKARQFHFQSHVKAECHVGCPSILASKMSCLLAICFLWHCAVWYKLLCVSVRRFMYLENVYALLGKNDNMRAVLLYVIQDRAPVVCQAWFLQTCSLYFGWLQECEKRGLVLSWSCVALEHVGLAAAPSKNFRCHSSPSSMCLVPSCEAQRRRVFFLPFSKENSCSRTLSC